MASTFAVTRNHLIFGVCLPFAVLLGYLLADINDPVSRVVIGISIAVLSFPLLMRWYHPLMILAWNSAAQVTFVPGAPTMWAFFSVVGLFFAVLNRSVNSENKFVHAPSLTIPLVLFAILIVVTAAMSGGVAIQTLGSSGRGGRFYFYILAAIAGYFALSSRTISPKHAYLVLAFFYLPGLGAALTHIAAHVGPVAKLIYFFYPGEADSDPFSQTQGLALGEVRFGGLTTASLAFFCWLLSRYGVKGVFDLARPWRLILFLGGISVGLLGGFRSHLIVVTLIFSILFIVEKLWRTKVMLLVTVFGVLFMVLLLGFADKLPTTIQRSFSFLPVGIDPLIKAQAESSSEWRINIWKSVIDEVPIYFFKGKGYNYSDDDMYMAQFRMTYSGDTGAAQGAAIAGDYHNGPLSLLIPFGIYGLVIFMWIIAAGSLYLYKNYQQGLPELKVINGFLFACFTARAIFFFSVFGAIALELYVYTGILGLSVALNQNKPKKPLQE